MDRRTSGGTSSSTSALPRPATSRRASGRAVSTSGSAASSTASPLRGSSVRPRKTIVGPEPHHCGRGSARSNDAQNKPLGITTGSPPRCCTSVARADSDTAMRAKIFSTDGRSMPAIDDIALDRGIAV